MASSRRKNTVARRPRRKRAARRRTRSKSPLSFQTKARECAGLFVCADRPLRADRILNRGLRGCGLTRIHHTSGESFLPQRTQSPDTEVTEQDRVFGSVHSVSEL